MKSHAENLRRFQWQPLIPIVQPKRKSKNVLGSYVEYLLIGCGPKCNPSAPAFLQVRRGFPSLRLRPVHCPKCVTGSQPSGRLADGCDEMCDIHTWARSRFTCCLPGNPRKRRKTIKEDDNKEIADLMGEEDDSTSDDGSGDGGLDGGDIGAGDTEAEPSEEENMPCVGEHG